MYCGALAKKDVFDVGALLACVEDPPPLSPVPLSLGLLDGAGLLPPGALEPSSAAGVSDGRPWSAWSPFLKGFPGGGGVDAFTDSGNLATNKYGAGM